MTFVEQIVGRQRLLFLVLFIVLLWGSGSDAQAHKCWHQHQPSTLFRGNSAFDYKVLCYFVISGSKSDEATTLQPENIDASLCSHIVYAYGKLENGHIRAIHEGLEEGNAGYYKRVTNLKNSNPNLKVLLALGGDQFNPRSFWEKMMNEFDRENMSFNMVDFLRKRNFDGIDLDLRWGEYRPDQSSNLKFERFIQEFQEVSRLEAEHSRREQLILALTVPSGSQEAMDSASPVVEVARKVEMIIVKGFGLQMTESVVGFHSALCPKSSENSSNNDLRTVVHNINYWRRKGVPSRKIILGVAFYGQSFKLGSPCQISTGAPSTGPGTIGKHLPSGKMTYSEICRLFDAESEYHFEEETQTPFAVIKDDWIAFEDERSVREKASFIASQRLGGAMVWNLFMDDFRGESCSPGVAFPLTRVINEELRGLPKSAKDRDWREIGKCSKLRKLLSEYPELKGSLRNIMESCPNPHA